MSRFLRYKGRWKNLKDTKRLPLKADELRELDKTLVIQDNDNARDGFHVGSVFSGSYGDNQASDEFLAVHEDHIVNLGNILCHDY